MGYPLSPDKNMSFTPSTPYVHKYKTEMCKNFETYGKCKYGDEVSIYPFSRYLNSNQFNFQYSIFQYSISLGQFYSNLILFDSYLTLTIL